MGRHDFGIALLRMRIKRSLEQGDLQCDYPVSEKEQCYRLPHLRLRNSGSWGAIRPIALCNKGSLKIGDAALLPSWQPAGPAR
jgi:hypothetical protein